MTLHQEIIHMKCEVNKGAHALDRGAISVEKNLEGSVTVVNIYHATCTFQYYVSKEVSQQGKSLGHS